MCFNDGSCAECGSNFSSSADVMIQNDNIRTFIIVFSLVLNILSLCNQSYKCSSVA
jgi:hypothetical protein